MRPFFINGTLHNVDGRASKVYSVYMGHVALHFSYKTLIGVHVFPSEVTVTQPDGISPRQPGNYGGEQSYRVHNAWGPTTAKHMKQCGLDMAKVRTEEELYEIVRGALFVDVVHAPLNQGEAA
jgi:hypothetical protein